MVLLENSLFGELLAIHRLAKKPRGCICILRVKNQHSCILQDSVVSVVMHLRCYGLYNDHSMADFLLSVLENTSLLTGDKFN